MLREGDLAGEIEPTRECSLITSRLAPAGERWAEFPVAAAAAESAAATSALVPSTERVRVCRDTGNSTGPVSPVGVASFSRVLRF